MNFYPDIMLKYCNYYMLDIRLVWCLIEHESMWNKWAIRYEPGYVHYYEYPDINVPMTRSTKRQIQKCSYGLMQIMGNHYYYLSKNKGYCTELFDPEMNINTGCFILHEHKRKNGGDPIDLYAAYNSGSLRKDSKGNYINHNNVKNFKKVWDSDHFELVAEKFPVQFHRDFVHKTT